MLQHCQAGQQVDYMGDISRNSGRSEKHPRPTKPCIKNYGVIDTITKMISFDEMMKIPFEELSIKAIVFRDEDNFIR